MRKKPPVSSQQLGFDFDAEETVFENTIQTIGRIQTDAINDTIDLFEGLNHDHRTTEAAGTRSEIIAIGNFESSESQPLQPAGLEDTGSLGLQQSGQTPPIGSTERSLVPKSSSGAAELGANSIGKSGSEPGGARSIGDELHSDRTAVKPRNYVITDADRLGQGGAKSKYRDNIAAITLLQTLRSEKRQASEEEQSVLVKYVGWGGLPQAFDHCNNEWHDEYLQLSGLLSKSNYEAARRSTQDAHYTSPLIIKAMYDGLRRMGLSSGKILEPAVGSGHFIGLMPSELRQNSKITGIELDPLTADIAAHLYPESTIINKGLQEVTIPERYFDAVIGNPPFGNQTLFDPNHRDLSDFSIHNYFIAKSLDKVKEGGVLAFVVSSYFLDAANSQTREWVADKAHFLGAVRLPNTAFKENALTEVTTDIVFLQRARQDEIPDRSWINVGTIRLEETDQEIALNNYYVQYPEMILGKMALASNMYRENVPVCVEVPGNDLSTRLSTALQALPQNIYVQAIDQGTQSLNQHTSPVEIPDSIKIGAFFIANNKLARRLPDLLDEKNYEWVQPKNAKAGERIKGMIHVRTALRELMSAERSSELSEQKIESLRAHLNQAYDGFIKQHGFISALPNKQAMSEDPDYPLLHALERNYDRGVSVEIAMRDEISPREPSAQKAAIFSKRVMKAQREITAATNSKDAMLMSLNECGHIDLSLMVRLTGFDEQKVINDLQGLIYHNPKSGAWESADQYLTGNVKLKLTQALEAAQINPNLQTNVQALKQVQPTDIDPVDIGVQLGSTWVPEQVVGDFVTHLFGPVHRNISYQPSLGKWMAKIGRGDFTTMEMTWGTSDISANKILELILENKSLSVKDPAGKDEHGNITYVVNEEKTAVVNQKADEIKQAFLDWVWEDQTRRESLARLYNDTFNTNVVPKHDGSHLTLPGASADIQLRKHQKDAIWRGIQEGGGLFDHVVGAGKTFVKIGVAMESRRMGLLNKPMLAVPNHLLLQWKDAFYSLYPNANVLVAEKSDFTRENRQKLFAKIATGDWDAVIVGHSSLKKIGMPEKTLNLILTEQVNDLSRAVQTLKEQQGDRITIKNLEKMKDRMQTRLERAAKAGDKDNVVNFDELGVDALLVDEIHEFKNLFINTSLSQVSGLGNLSGSDKAFDLFVKTRFLQMEHNGRGVYGGTGTPISNTIAEMYTVQRYMQYEDMKARGIEHFDAWASTFGKVVTGWELDATGTNYKLNSRFAKFQNVPELIAMYRTFADVISKSDLDRQAEQEGRRFPVPKVKGGKPLNIIVERSPEQAQYMGVLEPVLDHQGQLQYRADGSVIKNWNPGSIIYRMENLPRDPSQDNPLKITNDARKAGLDFRLIDPQAPDFEQSKVNEVVRNTVQIWEAWKEQKGTQLIFCDLSTPKTKGVSSPDVLPAVEKEQEMDEQETSVSMDELLASGNAFSVYEDIKHKLIEHGIPEQEIRFIHDAKTDLQKAKLFDQVNAGAVRVLLGSTAKMGAGTNVQRKLVAEHHIDAPWRPSDLEQREGRILRQGNEFYEQDPDGFEVELIRYATKQTYDARMWQTIEYKAAGIEQFRKGDSLQRTIEDIAGEAANAAEMKAAATGNHLIFAQVQISAELKKVEAAYANYKRNLHSIEHKLQWFEGSDSRKGQALEQVNRAIATRDQGTTDPWSFITEQRQYNTEIKDELMGIVLDAMQRAIKIQAKSYADPIHDIPVGVYRGFGVEVHARQGKVKFSLTGDHRIEPDNLIYDQQDKFSVNGFIQRLDNVLNHFDEQIPNIHAAHSREKAEFAQLRLEKEKPFQDMAKLELLRQDAREVLVELKKMQADDNYQSPWKPASLGQGAKQPNNLQPEKLSPALAFETLHQDEALRQHPELAQPYQILAAAKAYAEQNFETEGNRQRFLALSKQEICAALREGKTVIPQTLKVTTEQDKQNFDLERG